MAGVCSGWDSGFLLLDDFQAGDADVFDLDGGVFLAVAGVPAGVFAAAEFLDFELRPFFLGVNDLGFDGRPADRRLADHAVRAAVG